jgi:hypothetical protein
MKNAALLLIVITLFAGKMQSQEREKYGNTLNLGAGVGYLGYAPAGNINFEIDVFRNFTLAPFVSVYSHRDHRYWGDKDYPYRNYYYRETTVPIGVKSSYYFDELFRAGDRWDFYVGTSLGFAYRTTTWENGYNGDRVVNTSASPLYANMHIGSECHLTQTVGIYLDLSTGMSTFGFGFHF